MKNPSFEELLHKEKEFVLQTYSRYPVALKKGKGVYVWDLQGKKYLDFFAGIAVNDLGYAHKQIKKAVQRSLNRLIHASNYFYLEPQISLAEKLSLSSSQGKVFFANSGAEANECALKLARVYGNQCQPRRGTILTLENSFHGRTLATLFATGQAKYHAGFEPAVGKYVYLEPNNISRIDSVLSDDVSSVLIELVQGEGGVRVMDKTFISALSEKCRKKNVLFMVDEVQTGLGRTGRLFAYEHFGIIPDVITLAKPLAGGLPMGVAIIKRELAGLLKPGMHASSFGGGYMVCSVANCVIDLIRKEKFLSHIREMGDYLSGQFKALKQKYDFIAETRGLGLMQGMQLKFNGKEIVQKALEKGLIINCIQENVLRCLPPLVIEKEHIDRAVSILDSVFSDAAGK
ncbi:MAG: aspartate aminotransferase family protein [bacterium]|nr:aspartate aminotransferase family protein [bacterium]